MPFFVSRYTTDLLYTFELIFAVAICISCIIVALLKKDKAPLLVFLLTTAFHSTVELIAQGMGTRMVETTLLFGVIPVGYPFIPIIMGLFEGGLVGLSGLLFMRCIIYKDKFAFKYFLLIIAILLFFEISGYLMITRMLLTNPAELEITRRQIFSEGGIIVLIVMYSVSVIGILPWKSIPRKIKFGLLYYYLGIVLISLCMIIPLHVGGIWYIEYFNGVSYSRVNIFLDILIMYGYNGLVESAGFFMGYYVIFYYLKLLKDRK
ncbi:MAG: hypothetical protein ACTSYZ_14065 [Candidatus Helarchaeota archaeon]